jgi:hypothetical protein
MIDHAEMHHCEDENVPDALRVVSLHDLAQTAA